MKRKEDVNIMRFFEFNKFGYYALIGAKTEEEAINYYESTVADIEEEDGTPDEITREEAKEKLLNICLENENEEAIAEFDSFTDSTEPYLILIDGSLL